MRPIWIDNLTWPHTRDWQTSLIHQNLLAIGYSAWNGYLMFGPGLVVCQLTDLLSEPFDWAVDSLPVALSFVPKAQAAQLQLLDPAAVPALLQALTTYEPTQAILLLVCGNDEVNLSLLQDLAIAPADCYNQVRCRWDEFAPSLSWRSC